MSETDPFPAHMFEMPDNSDAALINEALILASVPKGFGRNNGRIWRISYRERLKSPAEYETQEPVSYFCEVFVWNDNGIIKGEIVKKPSPFPERLLETGATP